MLHIREKWGCGSPVARYRAVAVYLPQVLLLSMIMNRRSFPRCEVAERGVVMSACIRAVSRNVCARLRLLSMMRVCFPVIRYVSCRYLRYIAMVSVELYRGGSMRRIRGAGWLRMFCARAAISGSLRMPWGRNRSRAVSSAAMMFRAEGDSGVVFQRSKLRSGFGNGMRRECLRSAIRAADERRCFIGWWVK